ncbi:MAG: hypothetical protein BGO98_39275 [Myxococcales bacterium 68-20]|nr:hypothetical protein [Myxococcales bacterium]OJY26395.1 MAG: hypothetical protein BGO98_39275 [Myxococcales bacterium 68-20]
MKRSKLTHAAPPSLRASSLFGSIVAGTTKLYLCSPCATPAASYAVIVTKWDPGGSVTSILQASRTGSPAPRCV